MPLKAKFTYTADLNDDDNVKILKLKIQNIALKGVNLFLDNKGDERYRQEFMSIIDEALPDILEEAYYIINEKLGENLLDDDLGKELYSACLENEDSNILNRKGQN